jgi:hypothetical protein
MLDRDAAVEASRRMNAELGGLQIELAAMLWEVGSRRTHAAVTERAGFGGGDSTADARTAIGIDQPRKLLFLAIAERVSQPRMLHVLADLGARDGFLLDGGGSSAMGIGRGSTGIPATVLLGGGRPVATYIGCGRCHAAAQ